MTDTVTRLMALADKAIDAQDKRLGHLAQDYLQALQDELTKLFDPVVEPVETQWLAEMIMSDCGCSTNNQCLLDRSVVQQALSAQDEHARAEIFRHIELLEQENKALREELAAKQAPNSVEIDGIKTEPAQQAPVVWMPRTWAERYVSGVGAVTCSLSQMAGWVPLYTAPPPAHQQDPDALHMVIMDLARKQADRIAELESIVAEFKSVGWAISYDGQTPYRMWYEGDGEMLDLEVRRMGGTACKIELFAKVKK